MPAVARQTALKFTLFAGLALAIAALTVAYRDELTLSSVAARESQLRQLIADRPVLMYAAAFAVYVLVTGLSLPGATALTLTYGWLFGFWRGLVLVSFASTMGATVAFLLSRFLFRDAIQARFGDRLAKFNESLRKEGAFYLFTLRLVPAVPFFVLNVVMGLTPLPMWTFWWVSQLGMLPGTAVYLSAGAAVPDLQTLAERGPRGILSLQLLAAFVILGVFPLAVKRIVAAWRLRISATPTAANPPRAD
ncbi:MAG TPA: TVP38/TMEM64 family protein [Planctomycetaceae bacterium]|nr:TVP38/TMEM64 family protein [Planctomycetaceae bacterium]